MSSDDKPKRDWLSIRRQYETGSIGQRKLARLVGVPESTIMKRAMREKWVQNAKLAKMVAAEVQAKINAAAQSKAQRDLSPWMEAEKAKFTRAGVHLAKSGMKRVRRMMSSKHREPEAKSEAFISKSAETYHRIGRVALGMGDGSPIGGAVNLSILTNQAAVQVVRRESQE